MSTPLPELTDRMRQVFGLVVEAYLERGYPVGSKAIAPSVSRQGKAFRFSDRPQQAATITISPNRL